MLVACGALAAWTPIPAAESRSQLLRGSDALPAPAMQLRAGPVTLEFEPELAFVRYIKLGDAEILRGLYSAVRDSVWLTVLPKVTNIALDQKATSFRLTFDADCTQGPISFVWRGVITGDDRGTIRFAMDGEARTTFQRNRIGFCVLHPLTECAGKAYSAEKADGTRVKGEFPKNISPHQPVKDLKAITHSVAPGVDAEVRFEGEIFEMEDHRNWTDGNYKTYCTPLAIPYPVTIQKGQRITQAVTITLTGRAPAVQTERAAEVVIAPTGDATRTMPAIGLGWSGPSTLRPPFAPAHVRVDVNADNAARVFAEAKAFPLEIAVHATTGRELDAIAAAARTAGVRPVRWLAFHTVEKSTPRALLEAARKSFAGPAPVGGGTNIYFTELNRERPEPSWLDVVAYSINPQVHAFDDRSLVENLEPQAATVTSTKAFLGAKPIAISPVTLAPRFNPQAKNPPPNPPDYRQRSLFAAAWTVGSLKYLAEAGVSSVTYYEMFGAGGVIDQAGAYPVLHPLADAAAMRGAQVVPLRSSHPLRAVALQLKSSKGAMILVANLTLDPVIVRVPSLGPSQQVAMLDEHSPRQRAVHRLASANPTFTLGLLPYATAKVWV